MGKSFTRRFRNTLQVKHVYFPRDNHRTKSKKSSINYKKKNGLSSPLRHSRELRVKTKIKETMHKCSRARSVPVQF